MQLSFEIAGNQIEGARDYQEDAFMVTQLGEGEEAGAAALVVMADGMGGHAAGNVASNMAISTFNKTFSGAYPCDDVPATLKKALLAANDAIRAAVRETPGLKGMGCTMVAGFFAKSKLWWVSVGDSHLYLLRDRQLVKKNADHSYGGYIRRMREMGADVDPDPNLSPNMLMSAMIGEDIADIDLSDTPLQLLPKDRIIIASDGLDTLGQGAVIQYSAWSSNARDCVGALLKAVEDAHQARQDNTTVVCVDVRERAAIGATPPAKPATAPVAPREGPARGQAPVAPQEPQDRTLEMEEVELAPPPDTDLGAEQASPPTAAPEDLRPAPRKVLPVAAGIVAVLLLVGGAAYWLMGGDRSPGRAGIPDQPASGPGPLALEAPTEPPPPPTAEVAPEPPELPVAEVPAEPSPPAEVLPKVFRDALAVGGEGPEMVRVPGGEFTMGGRGSSLNPDEQPRRTVQVAPFAMGRYEVTYAEYDVFARATGRPLPSSDPDVDRATYPVAFVSWDDAYAYARWLSKETGKDYRLPSEAQWEYAARAGSATDFWWGRDVGRSKAHCFDCKSGLDPRRPARVGFFQPNPFGLYDTAGNVAEWVHDCYHPNYNGAPDDASVWEGGDCTRRVVRGGSFSNASSTIRSGKRERLVSTDRYDNVGFRVVRELPAD